MVYDIKRDSPAWEAGLREGDIITSVNRAPTPSVSIFVNVVNQLKGQLLLRVLRGRQAAFIVIK